MDITVKENGNNKEVEQEVIAAYNEVLRKLKETKTSQTDVKQQEQIKQEEQAVQEKAQLIEKVSQETPDHLVKNITELKSFVGKTLDDMKQRLLPEYDKFFTIRKAISLSETELDELYHIKVSAGTLTALVQAQKEKMISYENDLAESRKFFAQEKLRMAKEHEDEEVEFVAKRDAARKADQEKYENSRREVEKAQGEKRAAFEEEFESREARIAAREQDHQQLKEKEAWILAREQEYNQLKEKAGYHSEELRLATQKAESAVVEKLTSRYEYEAKLIHIQVESECKMYQQTIANLEEQIEQYKSLKQFFNEQPSFSDAKDFMKNISTKEEAAQESVVTDL